MTSCLNNVKQLSTTVFMYEGDWDDHYPIAENWNDALRPYARNTKVFICPKESGPEPSYAMNAELSELPESAVDAYADTVLLFESEPGLNQSGGLELLPSPPRHHDSYVIGYADGHVATVEDFETDDLIWYPDVSPWESSEDEW